MAVPGKTSAGPGGPAESHQNGVGGCRLDAKEWQRMAYAAAAIVAENLIPAVLAPSHSRCFEDQAARFRASASCGLA